MNTDAIEEIIRTHAKGCAVKRCKMPDHARAELAALRAAAAERDELRRTVEAEYERANNAEYALKSEHGQYMAAQKKIEAQAAQLREARVCLNSIALRGGNLPDESHTCKTGANDSVVRGWMYVDCRTWANAWLAANAPAPEAETTK